ncbi:unnamed protein product [Ectocarpus fasciculatus]
MMHYLPAVRETIWSRRTYHSCQDNTLPASHDKWSVQLTNTYETDKQLAHGMPTPCLANGRLSTTVDGEKDVDDSRLPQSIRFGQCHRELLQVASMSRELALSPRPGRTVAPSSTQEAKHIAVHMHQRNFSHHNVSILKPPTR